MKINIPSKVALGAALLSTPSFAHMFISSPSPIGGSAPKDPLDPSGSNFPCHGISLPASGGQKMPAGSKQTLAFNLGGGANTAVHGGGSCQMSITYETDAAKVKDPSNWKVIYSIEGGCPTDASGNLPTAQKCTTGDEVSCVNQFPFTIPKGVKNGHAIMAWTWFNNVGNREMYMNCINVDFSGGDGSEMKSFPTMFVANLASVNQCPTTENVNVKFPDAGKYVTTHTQAGTYPLAVPTGQGCSPGDADAGTMSAGGGGGGTAPAAAPTSKAAPQPAPTPAPTTQAPTYTPPAGSDGGCPEGQVSCPTPGDLVCVDATHFAICDVDQCALPQAVAPGTRCRNGEIMRRKRKRSQHLQDHQRKAGHTHGHGHINAPWQ
ncbi:hypothetical protein AC579_4938 [Pseudocercospora musae]|uniref:Chitin-binding type-4 domain-containing protein n=1 Tax=Pseudocercospora musae TaxID=113226 RepID=A0A139I944_9PEZI|nr:hypothetical protein AC579_4938 [Pseudocercospora musae]